MCRAPSYGIAIACFWLCLARAGDSPNSTLAGTSPRELPTCPWVQPLSQMPLERPVRELNRTNCVDVMLRSFQSNAVVKALIFMPGATDELNFFHRVRAQLTEPRPTILDAVQALTNQSFIRLTFSPPLLLLHTDEDPLEPILEIQDPATAQRVQQAHFVRHWLYSDRDWSIVEPPLRD